MKYKIMSDVVLDIAANLAAVRGGIKEAAKWRPTNIPHKDITLVAVSKTKPLALIKQAYDAGQRHFGENYLKELVTKSTSENIIEFCPDIKWHYIGSFQTKMASILLRVKNLHMLETLTSCDKADAINSRWRSEEPLRVMVQINTSGETSKSGIPPNDCVELCTHIYNKCPNLKLCGLMSIGAPGHVYNDGPNPDFESLYTCRKNVCDAFNLDESEMELSMGMSCDYEEAVKAGSTSVRVGTNIFGERDYSSAQKNR